MFSVGKCIDILYSILIGIILTRILEEWIGLKLYIPTSMHVQSWIIINIYLIYILINSLRYLYGNTEVNDRLDNVDKETFNLNSKPLVKHFFKAILDSIRRHLGFLELIILSIIVIFYFKDISHFVLNDNICVSYVFVSKIICTFLILNLILSFIDTIWSKSLYKKYPNNIEKEWYYAGVVDFILFSFSLILLLISHFNFYFMLIVFAIMSFAMLLEIIGIYEQKVPENNKKKQCKNK